jgi:hypothetical protein
MMFSCQIKAKPREAGKTGKQRQEITGEQSKGKRRVDEIKTNKG